MAALLVALALISGASCSALQGSLRDASSSVDRYPSVVQVESLVSSITWSHTCGGSILTSLHILSAANCFSGYNYIPRNRQIRAGSSYRQTGGIILEVQSEHNHPSFGTSHMEGDITVVRLASRLTFSTVIQQASIVIQGAEIPDGLPAVHVGWPSLLDGDYYYNSDVLLAVDMTTLDNESCGYEYSLLMNPLRVTETMICSTLPAVEGPEEDSETVDQDMCHADFGGPLIFSDLVVGVVSWSHSCTNITFPTVSTKVSAFTDWIIDVAV